MYSENCARCHGPDLKGQAGPALAGEKFASTLEFGKMSADQLFTFISTQMPSDHPGSLSQKEYEDVLAYILSRNGYPKGQTPLKKGELSELKLLPYPGQ